MTDKEHGDRTAYSILREGQKILVEYEKVSEHKITYQFKDATTNKATDDGPGGKTLDDVFGADRVKWIDSNQHAEMRDTERRTKQR